MLEHLVDINMIAFIGPGQGTEAKIVKRVLGRRHSDLPRDG